MRLPPFIFDVHLCQNLLMECRLRFSLNAWDFATNSGCWGHWALWRSKGECVSSSKLYRLSAIDLYKLRALWCGRRNHSYKHLEHCSTFYIGTALVCTCMEFIRLLTMTIDYLTMMDLWFFFCYLFIYIYFHTVIIVLYF